MNIQEAAQIVYPLNKLASHTPGPWEISPFGSVWAPSTKHDIVASMDRSKADDATLNANARLIAAAPDLLVALNAILAATDDSENGQSIHIGPITLATARAAISKATGQTA